MPGSTNFLQWNPDENNQEIDSEYLLETLRVNGAPAGALLPSPVGNKVFYQLSTFIAAFATMLTQKGYSPRDSNFADLVAVLTNVKCTSDFLAAIVTVPYATSVVFDAATSAEFYMLLTGNVTSSTLVHQTPGQFILFIIRQDAVGGRTFSWPSNVLFPGGICPIANSNSIQMFSVAPDGTVAPATAMMWVTPGGLALPYGPAVVSMAASGTVSAAYPEITEMVDASGGVVTRTFYAATAARAGYKINVKKMDSSRNTVYPSAAAGQYIDTVLSNFPLFQQYSAATFQCTGTGWILI